MNLNRRSARLQPGVDLRSISFFEGATDGAEIVDVHLDGNHVRRLVANVGHGLSTGGRRRGGHGLVVLTDENAVAAHVEWAWAGRTDVGGHDERDDADDRDGEQRNSGI